MFDTGSSSGMLSKVLVPMPCFTCDTGCQIVTDRLDNVFWAYGAHASINKASLAVSNVSDVSRHGFGVNTFCLCFLIVHRPRNSLITSYCAWPYNKLFLGKLVTVIITVIVNDTKIKKTSDGFQTVQIKVSFSAFNEENLLLHQHKICTEQGFLVLLCACVIYYTLHLVWHPWKKPVEALHPHPLYLKQDGLWCRYHRIHTVPLPTTHSLKYSPSLPSPNSNFIGVKFNPSSLKNNPECPDVTTCTKTFSSMLKVCM